MPRKKSRLVCVNLKTKKWAWDSVDVRGGPTIFFAGPSQNNESKGRRLKRLLENAHK
jgi:hypothetical protein